MKAAFLYNFAKFVEWPAGTFATERAPIVIGVLGDDPLGAALEQAVQGKTVNGRALVVKRLKTLPLPVCHILFITASERKRASQFIEGLLGQPVLTVGETEQFAQSGGLVNFFIEDNKVRFEINVDNAERSRIKISAKLLSLARVVRDSKPRPRS